MGVDAWKEYLKLTMKNLSRPLFYEFNNIDEEMKYDLFLINNKIQIDMTQGVHFEMMQKLLKENPDLFLLLHSPMISNDPVSI